MSVVSSGKTTKTVASPNAACESLRNIWDRNRAICSGEQQTKAFDATLDFTNYTNLLIPFSPSMTILQYKFYKAEAELPGISSEFVKMLTGGLLRKVPNLELPEDTSTGISNWIINNFTQNNNSLVSFLDEALPEEMQTGHSWVFVNYPSINEEVRKTYTTEDFQKHAPYPSLHKAETIINWKTNKDSFGNSVLSQIIVRGTVEDFSDNEFHPSFKERVWVHELVNGAYQIRVFEKPEKDTKEVVNGRGIDKADGPLMALVETVTNIIMNGKRLGMIPAWPLDGSIDPKDPFITTIVNKEVNLYNKLSRRNHLLYGASTFTPVLASDMTDERFEDIVSAGLGSWLKIDPDDKISVLDTPTAALADMDRAIAAGIEEMAKLGIRMLTPETAQSGVALEIRNAAQTAQLGTLNTKISNTLRKVIVFMINWRYDKGLDEDDVTFTLSSDFNPAPIGHEWLRLVTEWYEAGLLPREVWLLLAKQNDLVPYDYDDEEGRASINSDEIVTKLAESNSSYADNFSDA